jgi:hypothetical protein
MNWLGYVVFLLYRWQWPLPLAEKKKGEETVINLPISFPSAMKAHGTTHHHYSFISQAF